MNTVTIKVSSKRGEEEATYDLDLTKGKEFHKMLVYKGVLIDVIIKRGKK